MKMRLFGRKTNVAREPDNRQMSATIRWRGQLETKIQPANIKCAQRAQEKIYRRESERLRAARHETLSQKVDQFCGFEKSRRSRVMWSQSRFGARRVWWQQWVLDERGEMGFLFFFDWKQERALQDLLKNIWRKCAPEMWRVAELHPKVTTSFSEHNYMSCSFPSLLHNSQVKVLLSGFLPIPTGDEGEAHKQKNVVIDSSSIKMISELLHSHVINVIFIKEKR